MRWHLGWRELIVFAVTTIFVETVFVVGDSGPLWWILGIVIPICLLLAINLIVGAQRKRTSEFNANRGE